MLGDFFGDIRLAWRNASYVCGHNHFATMGVIAAPVGGGTVSVLLSTKLPDYAIVLIAMGGAIVAYLLYTALLSGICSALHVHPEWEVWVEYRVSSPPGAFARIFIRGLDARDVQTVRCEIIEPGGTRRIATTSGGPPGVQWVFWPNDFEGASRPDVGKYKVRWITAKSKVLVKYNWWVGW
jgi:hypothetical protein